MWVTMMTLTKDELMTMMTMVSWYQWYDNNLASMRHAGLQWPPDIWYKDVLQKTPLQLLCKDVLQKTVIEEVALNYQLSTVVSQGMTDSGVIKQFKGGDSHSLVKLSYSSSFYSSSAFSSSSFISSSFSSLLFFLLDPSISFPFSCFHLNPSLVLHMVLKLLYSTGSSSKPVRSISST